MRDVRIGEIYFEHEISQCPGIPDGMLDDLLDDERATSRCIRHQDSRGVVEYWVIPLDLAIKWKMEWCEDPEKLTPEMLPSWVSHYGVDEIGYINAWNYDSRGKRMFWGGPISRGWKARNKPTRINYLIPDTSLTDRSVRQSLAILNKRQNQPILDLRDKNFVDVYIKTGDLLNSIKIGYPHMGGQRTSQCVRFATKRLQKKSVRRYVKERLDEHTKKAFEKAGIDTDPQEWIVAQRIKLINKALKENTAASLNTAEKAIEKMSKELKEKAEGAVSPGNIPVGDNDNSGLSAERKKELARKRQNKGKSDDKDEHDTVSEVREAEHPFTEDSKG